MIIPFTSLMTSFLCAVVSEAVDADGYFRKSTLVTHRTERYFGSVGSLASVPFAIRAFSVAFVTFAAVSGIAG